MEITGENFLDEMEDEDSMERDDLSGEDMGDEMDYLAEEDDIEHDEEDTLEEENENVEEKLKMPCESCPGLLLTQQELSIHSSFHKDGKGLFLFSFY